MLDKKRWEACWSILRQQWPAYKNEGNDERKRKIYYRRLARFTSESIEQAVGRYLDTGKRFPHISQLIESLPENAMMPVNYGNMERMNLAIGEKISEMYEQGWDQVKVTWLGNKAGITGYKLDFWKFVGGKRVDFGQASAKPGA